jgi:hypothetical protein
MLRRSVHIADLAKRRSTPTGVTKTARRPCRHAHRYALSATAINTLPALRNSKLGQATFHKLAKGERWPEGTIKVTIEVAPNLGWLEFGDKLKIGDADDEGEGEGVMWIFTSMRSGRTWGGWGLMATTRRRKRKKRGRRRIRWEVLCALFPEAGPLAQVHFFFCLFYICTTNTAFISRNLRVTSMAGWDVVSS